MPCCCVYISRKITKCEFTVSFYDIFLQLVSHGQNISYKIVWRLSNLAFPNLCAMLAFIWEHCTIGKYSLWSMNFAKKIMDGKNLCLNIAAFLPLQIMINLYFQMNISVFQKHTNQFEVSIPYYFLQIKLFIWCSDIFFCITFI